MLGIMQVIQPQLMKLVFVKSPQGLWYRAFNAVNTNPSAMVRGCGVQGCTSSMINGRQAWMTDRLQQKSRDLRISACLSNQQYSSTCSFSDPCRVNGLDRPSEKELNEDRVRTTFSDLAFLQARTQGVEPEQRDTKFEVMVPFLTIPDRLSSTVLGFRLQDLHWYKSLIALARRI